MSDNAIKANEREALRLFERGVAAARGGQRRVAAGLLARAVQLNPRHEESWLWLSGMLDEPSEIAFCLRSVLTINPENKRAREGLAWLESRKTEPAQPAVQQPAVSAPQPEAPSQQRWLQRSTERLRTIGQASPAAVIEHELQARTHGESWWVNFRRTRRDMGRARVFLLTVPILLLMLTLALNLSLRMAVVRNEALAQEAATMAALRPTEAISQQEERRLPEIVLSELPPSDDARVMAYLSALDAPRAQLRAAVEDYRSSTSRPGGSSTAHAAAAQRFRDAIERSYMVIESLDPPGSLEASHRDYLAGLEAELTALDDMLAFYGSFNIELANRATIHMSEADRYIAR
ncbi:MAG TPA: hypothetical protein VFT99_12010, partial [Roseiflexaceae bacterium]|nr:hypothetical protein [Roseiflexaceae bacterium]